MSLVWSTLFHKHMMALDKNMCLLLTYYFPILKYLMFDFFNTNFNHSYYLKYIKNNKYNIIYYKIYFKYIFEFFFHILNKKWLKMILKKSNVKYLGMDEVLYSPK
jgi:hypothetical protein